MLIITSMYQFNCWNPGKYVKTNLLCEPGVVEHEKHVYHLQTVGQSVFSYYRYCVIIMVVSYKITLP